MKSDLQPFLLPLFLLLLSLPLISASRSIRPGTIPIDTDGNLLHAHGGHIILVQDTYYWFGESDKNQTFHKGVNCYSSPDLLIWTFRGSMVNDAMINQHAPKHDITVIERPKVAYNPSTKKYVMFIHVDTSDYSFASVAVYQAESVTGPFSFIQIMRPNGLESRDIGIFFDDDGTPYLLYASGHVNTGLTISSLSLDYTNSTGVICMIKGSYEAPTIMKGNGGYYLMVSKTSGWGPNEGKLFWAANLTGPWIDNGPISPSPDSYNSQGTYLLPLKDANGGVKYVYMGDRWDYPNLANASYVWLPVKIAPPGVAPGVQLEAINGSWWDLDEYLNGDFERRRLDGNGRMFLSWE